MGLIKYLIIVYIYNVPNIESTKQIRKERLTRLGLCMQTFANVGSLLLKINEADAKAAAVSAAISEPREFWSTLNTFLGVSMPSGLSQQVYGPC